jgi:peptidoglycan/xylan/chitin deacetylase (PgdA/CDA1 family)
MQRYLKVFTIVVALVFSGISVSAQTASEGGVVLTFDDCLRSPLINAFPLLEAEGLPYTVFCYVDRAAVHPDEINAETEWGFTVSQFLGLNGNKLVTMGSHSASHPHLLQVNDATARREVVESKSLYSLAGIFPTILAFPFGETDARIEKLTIEAGYIAARGTDLGLNDSNTNRYNMLSHSLDETTTLAQVQQMAEEAKRTGKIYILTIHHVGYPGYYNISPELFWQIVNMLKKERKIHIFSYPEAVCFLYKDPCPQQ